MKHITLQAYSKLMLSCILLQLLCSPLKANPEFLQLDSSAEVSLLTVAPGDEIYSYFGHSAIWIHDPVNHIDPVYNYGTFAFEDNFVYKFIKGDLNYSISKEHIEDFIFTYQEERRAVTQQVLNMNQGEKQKLLEYLEINHLPQNRYYRYDFLFDNCSTRIRDMLDSATGHRIRYDYIFTKPEYSYRKLINDYAGHHRWIAFGMDLLIGIPADHKAAPGEWLFLPDHMMSAYFLANIDQQNNKEAFVKKTRILVDLPIIKIPTPFYYSPAFVFTLLMLLVAVLTYIGSRKNRWFKGIDIILFIICGIIGLLMVFLWTSTRHAIAYENMNLIWANPLLLLALPFLFTKKRFALQIIGAFYGSMVLLLIVSIPWFPQSFNWAGLPLMIICAIRGFYIWYYNKKQSRGTSAS